CYSQAHQHSLQLRIAGAHQLYARPKFTQPLAARRDGLLVPVQPDQLALRPARAQNLPRMPATANRTVHVQPAAARLQLVYDLLEQHRCVVGHAEARIGRKLQLTFADPDLLCHTPPAYSRETPLPLSPSHKTATGLPVPSSQARGTMTTQHSSD